MVFSPSRRSGSAPGCLEIQGRPFQQTQARSEKGVCCVDSSVMLSTRQIDLETVKDMYLEKYDVTLKDALDSECGGDFKRLLIEILH